MTSRSERHTVGAPRAITSLQNERVKFVRSLRMRKVRTETGLFLADGVSVVITAREQGWMPRTLVYAASEKQSKAVGGLVDWAAAGGAECLEVTAPIIAKLAARDNPQNVMAVFEQHWSDAPAAVGEPADGVWLALEEVRDPGNLGTIIRTADAVGARGIILIGASCDPYSPDATRATMGSIFSVPLVRLQAHQFRDWIKGWPGDVVGTHLSAGADFRTVSYRGPIVLVMGSEGSGLSEEMAGMCTQLVKIPMAGRLDSLNLAVATALALYQIRGPHLRL
jgi:RNA methyltransferase, TrmH family